MFDALVEHSSEPHRIEAFYAAMKLVGDMDIKSVNSEGWFDDLYDTDNDPEDNTQIDESWMDDLAEAA